MWPPPASLYGLRADEQYRRYVDPGPRNIDLTEELQRYGLVECNYLGQARVRLPLSEALARRISFRDLGKARLWFQLGLAIWIADGQSLSLTNDSRGCRTLAFTATRVRSMYGIANDEVPDNLPPYEFMFRFDPKMAAERKPMIPETPEQIAAVNSVLTPEQQKFEAAKQASSQTRQQLTKQYGDAQKLLQYEIDALMRQKAGLARALDLRLTKLAEDENAAYDAACLQLPV
jgi:hypothetical protein